MVLLTQDFFPAATTSHGKIICICAANSPCVAMAVIAPHNKCDSSDSNCWS